MNISIEYLKQIRAEIDSTEKMIPKLKELLTDSAYLMLQYVEEEQKRNLAREIYWEWLEISTGVICAAFGCERHDKEFNKIVGPLYVYFICYDCGENYTVTLTSRAQLRSASGKGVCPACEDKRAQKHAQSHIERVAAQEQIADLKSMPYSEYLQTEHWQATRKQALKRAGYKCQMCGSNGELHVHHNNYENRGNELSRDLVVLCADCHKQFHFGESDE